MWLGCSLRSQSNDLPSEQLRCPSTVHSRATGTCLYKTAKTRGYSTDFLISVLALPQRLPLRNTAKPRGSNNNRNYSKNQIADKENRRSTARKNWSLGIAN